jgi:hypothetical protein
MDKEWRDVLSRKGADQYRRQVEIRDRWMKLLREWKDDWCRVLEHAYDAAYKPGGTKNPILVDGNPPLTGALLEKHVRAMEWVLNLEFTEQQRREFKEVYTDYWKKMDQVSREKEAATIEQNWEFVSTWKPYQLNKLRRATQPAWLANWSKPDAVAPNRWLLARYQEAYEPGGPRNAILVPGEPALTQLTVDHYCDYLEWVLDFSISGGLSTDQRKTVRDFLVKGWKMMDRDAFLATVKEWVKVAAQKPELWRKWTEAERPKLLAELRAVPNERNQYLLEIFTQERQKFDLMDATERQRHETTMRLIDNMRSSWHWERNPRTGQLDYVPGR